MKMTGFPLSTTDWAKVVPSEHPGETGVALWRTQTFQTTLSNGESFTLSPGNSYQVADGESSHRSSTRTGAKLFIVD